MLNLQETIRNQEKKLDDNKMTIDQYGKMRVCEYFPIALIDFDEEGNVVAPDYNLYNDLTYLKSEDYLGEINNEDFDNYKWNPDIIETNEDIYNSILARVNGLQ